MMLLSGVNPLMMLLSGVEPGEQSAEEVADLHRGTQLPPDPQPAR